MLLRFQGDRGMMPMMMLGIAAIWCAPAIQAQQTATAALQLRVLPEAHLSQPRVAIRFWVSADGASDIAAVPEAVAAWVRALPGQRIRLMASLESFTGPAGPVPAEVGWSGSSTRATGGAQEAACTSGTLAAGSPQDLVAGWNRSGTLTCSVTFSLAEPRSLAPGAYTAVIDMRVRAE